MALRDPARPHEHIATEQELRGVPLVGGRRMSAIAGSSPEHAFIQKESRGKMRRLRESVDSIPREMLSVHYDRKGPPTVTRATRESGRFFP